MPKAPLPVNENERIAALRTYPILEEIIEAEYQEIARIAAYICETPISAVTLIDENIEWHKGQMGIENETLDRKYSFCSHAILEPNKPLIVPDAREDIRFRDNLLVSAPPPIIFYAGIPLVTEDGYALGALCVIDEKPRKLTKTQLEILKTLSSHVVHLFELRKAARQLEEQEKLLKQAMTTRKAYVEEVAVDIKMALRAIEVSAEVLEINHISDRDEEALRHLNNIQQASADMMAYINKLKLSKA